MASSKKISVETSKILAFNNIWLYLNECLSYFNSFITIIILSLKNRIKNLRHLFIKYVTK